MKERLNTNYENKLKIRKVIVFFLMNIKNHQKYEKFTDDCGTVVSFIKLYKIRWYLAKWLDTRSAR